MALEFAEGNHASGASRLQRGADDADVGETLPPRRLGLAIREDAVREIEELRRELVPLREPALTRPAVDRQMVDQRLGVFERRIDTQASAGPEDLEPARVRRSEAAGERGETPRPGIAG